MMTQKNYDLLAHLADCCEHVDQLLARLHYSFEEYLGDTVFQDAAAMNLVQIGELAKRLSAEFKSETKQIPWTQIVSNRNIFVHDYGSVDHVQAWKTLTESVPTLKEFCEDILSQYSDRFQSYLNFTDEDPEWEP